MSIGFSKRWFYQSDLLDSPQARDAGWTEEEEKEMIIRMITQCDKKQVRDYAANLDPKSGKDVYVRTGIHTSTTEPRLHIQAVMGGYDPENPRASSPGTGFTVHIIWAADRSADKPFEAHVYKGQPHLKRVESTARSTGEEHKGGGSDGEKRYTGRGNRHKPY